MAASDIDDLIREEARRIAERDLKALQRLIRKRLKELHDLDDLEETE